MLNPDSGKCLDDPNRSATAGTRLRIWGCNGTNAQRWHLPWPGADTAGGPDRAAPPPRDGDVRITAATQDGPPYTHIVLTAKNTSRHSCR
ncbi:RICIN domain-containing protein, partial [Streptomyces griseofuscus]|uniref:RICIN domain-containing protein n=1 Tax=Streptomyces griseofuscus TaxID=146922 RepID=UPI0033D4DB5C